ncbi:MAG: hypothetical protein ACYC63_12575 [Armatimonadota bacterium]
MRRTLLMAGLVVAAYGAAFAQSDLAFSAGSTNLLLTANGGRILAFSSQLLDENKQPVPQWQVSNLIDGEYVTGSYRPANSHGWSSNTTPKPGMPEWVIFAFANEQTRLISRVVFDPTTIDPPLIGRAARDFELYASATTKDGPWALIKRGQLLNKPIKQTFDFLPVEARYLRLSINSNWGSDRFVELGEVECYEAIAGNDAIDQLIVRMESLLGDLKRYRDSVKLNQPIYPELRSTPATTTPAVAPGPTAPATTAPGAGAPVAAPLPGA